MKEIKICMGSSCYARGNKENIKIIQAYIEEKGLDAEVKIAGILCSENCGKGPVITVDGELYRQVDASLLTEVLSTLPGVGA